MAVKKFKVSFLGSLFLLSYGVFLTQKNQAVEFQDSNRYFTNYIKDNSIWIELIEHTGRNIQTLLFSTINSQVNDIGKSAILANLIIWLITASTCLFFLDKNLPNKKIRYLSMLLVILVFTSNLVASWIIAILSESIALSFLIPLVIISLLTILREVKLEKSRTFILLFHICLFASQPIWGALVVPLVLGVFYPWNKNVKQILIIGITATFSLSLATLSHRLPYENTGLTFRGFESLTRAYAFSFSNRFGEVALGKNIYECPLALDLLQTAQATGTPMPLFLDFKSASAGCEELVSEMNSGKSNSIPNLIFNDFSKTLSMFAKATYAIANQQPLYGDSLSSRPIGIISSDLLVPFGIFLAPVGLILLSNKKELILINLHLAASLAGGYLLYFQVGIEGERHSLPAAIIIGITSWIIVIKSISNQNALKSL